MNYVNCTSPQILLSINGGEVGLALVDQCHVLTAWVGSDTACSSSAIFLTNAAQHNQWFHVALSWFKSAFSEELRVFLDGAQVSDCKSLTPTSATTEARTTASDVYSKTSTHASYLVTSSYPLSASGFQLAVGVVNMAMNFIDSDIRISTFMGLSSAQGKYFAMSTFYWPMSDYLTDLSPERLFLSSITRERDRRNVERSAVCTDGSAQSYAILAGDNQPGAMASNLVASCLFSGSICKKYIFAIDFRPNGQFPTENKEYSIVGAPPNPKQVGLQMTFNPATTLLTVTVRTPTLKCQNKGNLTALLESGSQTWLNIYVNIYDSDAPSVTVNDRPFALSSLGTCVIEESEVAPVTTAPYPKIAVGNGLPICVSDVMLLENPENLANLDKNGIDICYEGVDALLTLKGQLEDHKGNPNASTDLSEFTSGISTSQISGCLGRSMLECTEFTFCFWMKINLAGTSPEVSEVTCIQNLIFL